jgi:sarcosine oxidase subunit beta
MRVAVVGGGAVGTTAAYDLARRGVDVWLYERDAVASDAASTGRAAGICYDAFADRRDADLARRALGRFRDRSGEGFSFTDCPYVWLARAGDDSRAAAIEEQVPRMREHGLDVALLDADELAARFPALETADVAVAAVARDAGYLDPAAYAREMADHAREAGATIKTGTEVGVTTGPDPAVLTPAGERAVDAVLVAAGAHAKAILAAAGVTIPLKPYRVQALVTGATDPAVPMLYDATAGVYLRPRGGGVLVGDGTEPRAFDPDDWKQSADDDFVADAREHLRRAIGVAPAVERAWAGLCTATPDRDPLVGEVADCVYVATGWQGHGVMRAPAIGDAVAREVLGADGIPGFDPGRFDGDEEFAVAEGMAVE